MSTGTGVPESDELDTEPDFRAMNLIGYHAMALGNHEFDKQIAVLRKQEKWARFPLLAANVYKKSTGERMFKPWAVFNRLGLKIAVLGLLPSIPPGWLNGCRIPRSGS